MHKRTDYSQKDNITDFNQGEIPFSLELRVEPNAYKIITCEIYRIAVLWELQNDVKNLEHKISLHCCCFSLSRKHNDSKLR